MLRARGGVRRWWTGNVRRLWHRRRGNGQWGEKIRVDESKKPKPMTATCPPGDVGGADKGRAARRRATVC